MEEAFTQHHIKARDEDIARYCFIPGDHVRGRKIASRLEDAKLVSDTRGYFVYTGYYKGVRMTVCSTGMGGPQVAIAMEELGNMGADTFIRLGSAGGVADNTGVGDIVIATASYRGGGTGDEYLPKPFPAVAHFEVTRKLVDTAKELGIPALVGPVASGDAFYAPKDKEQRELWRKGGILCVEMESDTEFIVGLYRGFRCGAAFVLDNGPRTREVGVRSGNRNIAHHGKDPAYVEGEDRLIEMGLLAMYRLAQQDGQVK
ncbi:MAG: nucleoside phosphorylase [Candidatus Fermentithermobacillus carboniphilus]|uniref:Uridine phosphorylase n=1 Tax=Candidatus Fermentithermobacillus carboniphilus TaxID=3085328 RepID=A0AAT9LD72_9FIRM|nr:MAG: nucleoside phosphorylase [Candidatus Fermentithermobacillus carboniphilus]